MTLSGATSVAPAGESSAVPTMHAASASTRSLDSHKLPLDRLISNPFLCLKSGRAHALSRTGPSQEHRSRRNALLSTAREEALLALERAPHDAAPCEARATPLHQVERGNRRQSFFNFQRPRRNCSAAITASIENAVVMERKTPRGPKLVRCDRM